jgi:hypothetical protein
VESAASIFIPKHGSSSFLRSDGNKLYSGTSQKLLISQGKEFNARKTVINFAKHLMIV